MELKCNISFIIATVILLACCFSSFIAQSVLYYAVIVTELVMILVTSLWLVNWVKNRKQFAVIKNSINIIVLSIKIAIIAWNGYLLLIFWLVKER